jgi:guanosine-3',5'-bis(diphosphate) 3'-pyrophosphohydrolase
MNIDTIDFSRCDYNKEEIQMCLYDAIEQKYKHNADALERIFQALALMQEIHGEQWRDGRVPFIIHPMRVALMLVKYEPDVTATVLMAALLHDILEYSDLSVQELEAEFGNYVTKLVVSITMRLNDGSRREKREARLRCWQSIMQSSHEVRLIKTFEVLDNMLYWRDIPGESPAGEMLPLWLEEVRELFLPLAHATNMQAYALMKQEYAHDVEQGFANQSITK